MPLAVGTRFGPYEIVALVGAGGMGEVYRTRDTKLHRDVAIKVLPEAVAHDPERLARFEREARTLASLNHPNIAQIHGLEESDGIKALVMELVEGPTLADCIAQRPIPVDEALPIAKQIAEALQAAHEQSIIHRDLKQANVKVTPDGVVKVLDFGLAKLAHPQATGGQADVTGPPTITSPTMMTGVGVILGTVAYMAPEQAKGREADKRSDIWAFGCVLYEMLAGKRPFDGEDNSDTLANVLKIDPDWSALPSDTPPAIRALLQSCLAKDRRRRVADVSTALFVLDQAPNLAPLAGMAAVRPVRARSRWTAAAAVAATAAVAGGTVVAIVQRSRAVVPRISRLEMAPTGTQALSLSGFECDFAITSDGSRVVYEVGRTRATPRMGISCTRRRGRSGPFVSISRTWRRSGRRQRSFRKSCRRHSVR